MKVRILHQFHIVIQAYKYLFRAHTIPAIKRDTDVKCHCIVGKNSEEYKYRQNVDICHFRIAQNSIFSSTPLLFFLISVCLPSQHKIPPCQYSKEGAAKRNQTIPFCNNPSPFIYLDTLSDAS